MGKGKVERFFYPDFDKVYVASIDSVDVQLFLSSVSFNHLCTFDDGTANIMKNSFLYKEVDCTFKKLKFVFKFFNKKYNLEKIKDIAFCHYTVYRGRDNILSAKKTKYISLFDKSEKKIPKENGKSSFKSVSFLLGQPIYELATSLTKKEILEKNIYNSQKAINIFNIDYYYPHPRENYHLNNANYVMQELIFEDFFLENMNENTFYKVYTFFSGAVISLLELDNVEVISLKPSDIADEILPNYDIMSDFNISVIEF